MASHGHYGTHVEATLNVPFFIVSPIMMTSALTGIEFKQYFVRVIVTAATIIPVIQRPLDRPQVM